MKETGYLNKSKSLKYTSEELEKILDSVRKNIKTDSYQMSIGEIIIMYEEDEIVFHIGSECHSNKWTTEQKSKLIESILIGLPLPSFFMVQDDEGSWEVVDGIQRLSTIFDFIGILKEPNKRQESYERFECLVEDLFYLKEFANKGWDDLSRRMQFDFKRIKINLNLMLINSRMEFGK